MESTFEEELKRLWGMYTGSLFDKLIKLGGDLMRWADSIKRNKQGLIKKLEAKVDELM